MSEQAPAFPKRRGRPRKHDQNPAPAAVSVAARVIPRTAILPIEEARRVVYETASAHAAEVIALFVEAVQQARADMRAGRPVSRQGLEAGKVLLGVLGTSSRDTAPGAKDLALMSVAELQAIVDAEAARRGNAAKEVTLDNEAADLFE